MNPTRWGGSSVQRSYPDPVRTFQKNHYKYQSLDDSFQGGGYAQYNPYGGANPYSEQPPPSYSGASAVESGHGGYGRPSFLLNSPAQTDHIEMNSMNRPPQVGQAGILDQCRNINEAIQDLKFKRQGQLSAAQNALLDSSTDKEDQNARQTLDYIEDDLNHAIRALRDDIERAKKTPGSGDARVQPQLTKAIKDLKGEIAQYQKSQSNFQARLREQVRRRYEIANPEATGEELDRGVDQVLMGQAQAFQVCITSSVGRYASLDSSLI